LRLRLPARGADAAGFIVFALLLIHGLLHHGMWRDEMQAWLIARASPDPLALLQNLRFEGQPGLWHLLLWPFARLTSDPVAMQGVQAVISLLVIWLVWFRAPFSRLEKTLLCASYFLAYEYGVLSRNYGLGVMFLFLFLAAHRLVARRPAVGWLLLGLAFNTHPFVSYVTAGVGGVWLWTERRRWRQHAGGLVLAAVLCAVAAAPVLRSEIILPGGWHFDGSPGHFVWYLGLVSRAFVPVADPGTWHYWNPSLEGDWRLLAAVASALLASFALGACRGALVTFWAVTLGLVVTLEMRYGSESRHVGVLFVLLVVLVWFLRDRGGRAGHPLAFAALLACNAAGGVKAVVASNFVPLSTGRESAQWIEEHHLERAFWMANSAPAASTVAGYLGRPLYDLDCACTAGYVRWGSWAGPLSAARARVRAREAMARRSLTSAYLLSNQPLGTAPGESTDALHVEELARFTGAEVRDENFHLYRLSRAARGQDSCAARSCTTPPAPDGGHMQHGPMYGVIFPGAGGGSARARRPGHARGVGRRRARRSNYGLYPE